MIAVERQLGSGREPNARTVPLCVGIHSHNGNARSFPNCGHLSVPSATYFISGFSGVGASAPTIESGKSRALAPEETPFSRLSMCRKASSRSRLTTGGLSFLLRAPRTFFVVRCLPGTVNRVATGVSYRKQSLGTNSTRNVPAHAKRLLSRSLRLCRPAMVACP